MTLRHPDMMYLDWLFQNFGINKIKDSFRCEKYQSILEKSTQWVNINPLSHLHWYTVMKEDPLRLAI